MTIARKRWIGAIAAVAFTTLGFYVYQFVVIGSAYVAHMLCSGVFVSGRTPESVIASDLAADDLAPLRYVTAHVNTGARRVTTSVLGVAGRTATYRNDLGCTLSDEPRSN